MMGYREVNIGSEPHVAPADQPAPRLEWVEVADLVIDETYQRPLGGKNWAAIRRIAKNFRWSRFGPILCAPMPGGKLAIVDGQHRCHAALICGFKSVPAMIVPMGMAEQAAAFAGVNGDTVRMTGWHVYKAALAAGEGWALASRDAVEAAGCRLMTYQPASHLAKAGDVYCVATVKELVASGLGEVVTAGLAALRQSGAEAEAYQGLVLKAWFQAIASDNRAMKADLPAFLDEFPLIDTVDQAASLHRQPDWRHIPRKRIAETLVTKGLKSWLAEQRAAA